MSVVDLCAERERRGGEHGEQVLAGVGRKALRDAERAFVVGNALLGVDPDMAIDVYRGTRRRLIAWVKGSLHEEPVDLRTRARDLAANLYQAHLLDMIDGCYDRGAPRAP